MFFIPFGPAINAGAKTGAVSSECRTTFLKIILILLSLLQSKETYLVAFISPLLHFGNRRWSFSSLLLPHSIELKRYSISRLHQTFNFKQKTDIFPTRYINQIMEKFHQLFFLRHPIAVKIIQGLLD